VNETEPEQMSTDRSEPKRLVVYLELKDGCRIRLEEPYVLGSRYSDT
jgi:hypothetical protein